MPDRDHRDHRAGHPGVQASIPCRPASSLPRSMRRWAISAPTRSRSACWAMPKSPPRSPMRWQDNEIPLVLDPVLVSTSGAPLLDDAGVSRAERRLIRRAPPGHAQPAGGRSADRHPIPTASTGCATPPGRSGCWAPATCCSRAAMARATRCATCWWMRRRFQPFERRACPRRHTHGTGCTLATAIACGLAQGRELRDAVSRAQLFVQEAIRSAPGLGSGHGPLAHNPEPHNVSA